MYRCRHNATAKSPAPPRPNTSSGCHPASAIDANSSERVTDRSQPDDSALDPLRSLESGDTDSLPFSLEGRVHTLDDGYLRFEQKGHLYRVPGRPGQFRAAVMRASELVRENKL